MTLQSPNEASRPPTMKEKELALLRQAMEDLKRLFGQPPTALGENLADFDRILLDLLRVRCSNDFLLKLHTWNIAIEVWGQRRLERVKQLALNRRLRQIVQVQKA